MKIIKAYRKGQGYDFQISDDKYDDLSQYKWQFKCKKIIKNCGRAYRFESNKIIYLSRQIMGFPVYPEFVVDHIDGNRRNCQNENLRIVTHSQSMLNRYGSGLKLIRNKRMNLPTGIFKSFRNKRIYYSAVIGFQNKKYRCGRFYTIEQAVEARKQKAQELGIQQFLRT